MRSLSIAILRTPTDRKLPASGYRYTLELLPEGQSLVAPSNTPVKLPDQLIAEVAEALRSHWQVSDTVAFAGIMFRALEDALAAIEITQPTWI